MQAHDGIKHIITFCSGMDDMLGGGVALGQVTEFCGVPGASVCQSKVYLFCYIKVPRQAHVFVRRHRTDAAWHPTCSRLPSS